MSDINNNEQGNIYPAGNNNMNPGFSGGSEENHPEISFIPEREVKREALHGMGAVAGRSQVKSQNPGLDTAKIIEDKKPEIKISQDRINTVSEDMKPFLHENPGVVMKAAVLGDIAFESAVKENLTDPYAKAALIEFAATQEFGDSSSSN